MRKHSEAPLSILEWVDDTRVFNSAVEQDPYDVKMTTTQTQRLLSDLVCPHCSSTASPWGGQTVSQVFSLSQNEEDNKTSDLSLGVCEIQIKQYLRNNFVQSTGFQTIIHPFHPSSPLSLFLMAKGYIIKKSTISSAFFIHL